MLSAQYMIEMAKEWPARGYMCLMILSVAKLAIEQAIVETPEHDRSMRMTLDNALEDFAQLLVNQREAIRLNEIDDVV